MNLSQKVSQIFVEIFHEEKFEELYILEFLLTELKRGVGQVSIFSFHF